MLVRRTTFLLFEAKPRVESEKMMNDLPDPPGWKFIKHRGPDLLPEKLILENHFEKMKVIVGDSEMWGRN